MGEQKVVDLSRFLLFEAAGDSEADVDANKVSFGMVDDDDQCKSQKCDNEDDIDDAESCSYDVVYSINVLQDEILYKNEQENHHHTHHHVADDEDLDEGNNGRHDIDQFDRDHDDDDDDGMKEDEEEMMSEVTSTANSYASRKCARKMSEIEKSRLFWEACLAS